MKKPNLFQLHHGKPITRRDFLSSGILGYSAMLALPDLLGLTLRKVRADLVDAGVLRATHIPFMAFDMAGGAALPGSFLVGKQGGPMEYLQSYDRLGWNPKETGALNTEFGLPMSAKASTMLAGILATASVNARAKLRFVSLCHFAQDDTSNNKLNASTLILKATVPGQYISNGLGTKNSVSGGNSDAILNDLALKPGFVQNIDDVLGAAKFGGDAYKLLADAQMKALADGGVKLSAMQSNMLAGESGGPTLQELSKVAYAKNKEFVAGIQGLDPRRDAQAAAVYAINQNTLGNDPQVVSAAIAMNVLKGHCGPGVWTLGGCDYHDGTQTSGDALDRRMGEQIGRAVELAHQMQKPFFFQLLTDGGCESQKGSRKWTSDSGDKCMTVLGYYNPKEAPKTIKLQAGHFTDGQSAERNTLIGSNPANVAYAVLANYLQVIGKIDKFHEFAPGVFTKEGELKSILLFEAPVA